MQSRGKYKSLFVEGAVGNDAGLWMKLQVIVTVGLTFWISHYFVFNALFSTSDIYIRSYKELGTLLDVLLFFIWLVLQRTLTL